MFKKTLLSLIKKLEKCIFPKACLICNEIIASGCLCIAHFNELQFITKPACKICSYPFEFEIDDNMLCPSCITNKPSYHKALSIFKYNQASKSIIGRLKYGDATYLAQHIAQLLYDNGKEMLKNDVDFIIPVPLHKKRLRKRRYNQSALICDNLSQLTNLPTIKDLLIRTKNTPPQTSLNQKLRRKN
ncbi:MAG: double zinc ribbon domain-containing protein, partial [Proteobacteria bacterium]|nr:double zinc ribbon domain-containing protein [Pseudomonadota bacterium]